MIMNALAGIFMQLAEQFLSTYFRRGRIDVRFLVRGQPRVEVENYG
jgi:hypothetical protein